MAPVAITESELLDALAVAAAGNAPEDARTVQELAVMSGCSKGKVTTLLQRFQRDGRLVVHRVPRARMDGQVQPVPAYTIKPAKRGK